jgi:putative adenylate-forming enzyme
MKFKLKIIYFWLKINLFHHFNSRAKLLKFQDRKMKRFVKKTLRLSPFYNAHIEKGVFDFNSIPEISKTEFMDEFDNMNTQGIELKDAMEVALDAEKSRKFKSEINGITVGLSTGTSGKRGLFLVSENERAQWVSLVMSKIIKPKLFKKQKVAFFLRANSNLYSSVESNLFEFKYFDIFKPIAELLIELNNYQPTILAAQPSILIDIAEAQKEKKISIQPIQILSFAEVLHNNDKEIISSIFKTKLKEIYQCTEGLLGISCDYGTMHLNEDFIRFDKEWIDEDKFYPIVTDFTRHTQPVVKYKMNDVLQIKKEICPCGSVNLAIEKIIGRDDDVLLLNNIKVYPDLISRKIAIITNEFQKYTILQNGAFSLKIGLQCLPDEFENTSNKIKQILLELFASLGIEQEIEFDFSTKIDHVNGNKARKIKRIHNEN